MSFNFINLGIFFVLFFIAWILWRKGLKDGDYTALRVYIFYVFGALILAFLLVELPFQTIARSFEKIRWGIIYVMATAIFWFLIIALSLQNILGFSMGYFKVLYIQFVGEGFSIMIPSGGLAGELLKIQKCREEVGTEKAVVSVVFDRLTHIISSSIMAALTSHLSAVFIPMKPPIQNSVILISLVFYLVSFTMVMIALSKKFEEVIFSSLKKLRLSQDIRIRVENQLRKRFLLSLFYRTIGRILGVSEYFVILLLLGISPTPMLILAVITGISISASVFFMIPQGLGVNEAGVAGAFSTLGMDPAVGLAVGLIRRARIVFWALCGVSLYGLVFFIKKRVVGMRKSF